MEHTDIKRLKRRLDFQRQEIQQFLKRIEEETQAFDADCAKDSGDRSVTNLSRESLFEQSSQRRNTLRLIEVALRRIAEGSYGVCVTCGDIIQERRLEALPWTQFCLRCQEVIEKEVGDELSGRVPSMTFETWKRAD